MRQLYFFAICFCAFILMPSCSGSSDNALIGSWEQIVEEDSMKTVDIVDFVKSGLLKEKGIINNMTTPAVEVVYESTGKYTYVGDTITIIVSAKDINIKSVKIQGGSDEDNENFKKLMTSEFTDINQIWTDVKIEGDSITATLEGQKLVLKRK